MKTFLAAAGLSLAVLGACSPAKAPVAEGATVRMHYTLTVQERILDTSRGKDPLEFKVGTGAILPALEKRLMGMRAGEIRTLVLPAEEGYGGRREEAVRDVPKKLFPEADNLQAGRAVAGRADGKVFRAIVVSVEKDTVRLDFNHPLAGETLRFDVEIVEVRPPTS